MVSRSSWRTRAARRLRPTADRLRQARERLAQAEQEGRSAQERDDLARDLDLARMAYDRAKRFGPGAG